MHRGEGGFSTIEVVLAMILVGIVAAITIPRFPPRLPLGTTVALSPLVFSAIEGEFAFQREADLPSVCQACLTCGRHTVELNLNRPTGSGGNAMAVTAVIGYTPSVLAVTHSLSE